MADTYTQLYYHIVFAVQGRENLISDTWREELYKYIGGIVNRQNQKLYIINGTRNHVHMLLGMNADKPLANIVKEIKANSSKFINERKFLYGHFCWQEGYGAFTIGQSQIKALVNYIKTQEEHHKEKSFKEEIVDFLKIYNIDFNEEHILKDF